MRLARAKNALPVIRYNFPAGAHARYPLEGHRLHYREHGRGPLLIILPGNTASSALHERELVEFCRTIHAVALDLLGTGQSERWTVGLRIGGSKPPATRGR